jgi:hypothetical protein
MPQGTINREEVFRYELKSLPAMNGDVGGYVVLRQLSYHQMMQRRDLITKVGWEERRGGRNTKRNEEETIKAIWEIMNVAEMEYVFKYSIVEHNITDGNNALLDFTNPHSYRDLNPKVGEEISNLIDDLNKELEDGEVENFPTAPKPSFGEEPTPSITSDVS